jgi:hypothetical protein
MDVPPSPPEAKADDSKVVPKQPVKRKSQEELAVLAQYIQTTQGILNLNGKNINDLEIKLFLPYFKACIMFSPCFMFLF